MPNARVLYVSATGATESTNLGYMSRLGLWGPGTAFQSRHDFVNLLQQRGVGALPCLAGVLPFPRVLRAAGPAPPGQQLGRWPAQPSAAAHLGCWVRPRRMQQLMASAVARNCAQA